VNGIKTKYLKRISSIFYLFRPTGGAAPDNGQGARARSKLALQPDPPAAHVPHAGGPGAPSTREGHRPHPVQAGRPRTSVRAQDTRGD